MRDNEKNDASIFNHFDFFMVRTSTFEYKIYEKIIKSVSGKSELKHILDELERENKKDFVFEAIKISSPSLMDSILNYEKRDNRQKKQIRISLINYLNRMSSRATPYGLMASVGFGEFEGNFNKSNTPNYIKEASIDSEWIQKFISKNIANPKIVNSLKLKVNPTIYIKDNELIVDVRPPGTNETTLKKMSSTDPYLIFILTSAREIIGINNLVAKLKKKFQVLDINEIRLIILQLLHNGFLISDFLLTSNKQFSLEFGTDEIGLSNEKNEVFKNLSLIRNSLMNYKKSELGTKINYIDKFNRELMTTFPVKNPIQVDLFNSETYTLPSSIGQEIIEVAEVLFKISRGDTSLVHLNEYRQKFIQKYGFKKEISLRTLLDEDEGLGDPNFYINHHSQIEIGNSNNNDIVLAGLLKDLNHYNLNELVLTDDIINKLTVNKQKENFQNSLELYFEHIEGSSIADKDADYSLVLGPNVGTRGAGKTFARFEPFFENIIKGRSKNILDTINERTSEDIIYAEIRYLPNNARSINILPYKSTYLYQIPINCIGDKSNNFNIELDDIIVGIEKNSLYLKSKKLRKQIIPVKNHMLNHRSFPKIVRFLCEMEFEGQDNWTPFNWGALENQVFLPRVRYKNTIIYSARWLFNLRFLNTEKHASLNSFIDEFNNWRITNRIPRYLNIGRNSNRLIYDLDNLNDLDALYTVAKKLEENEVITLVEANRNFKTDRSSLFSQEIVLPLYSKNKYKSIPSYNVLQKEPQEELKYFPGSIWSSIKIYTSKKGQEKLLSNCIKNIIIELEMNNLIERWYFLKYRDPKSHIRFRLKGSSEKNTQIGIEMLLKSLENNADILVNEIIIDTYRPEIEKYGGPNLIESAENWFMKDSESILQWLYPSHSTKWSKIDFAVFSIIDIIENFSVSLKIIITWIDSVVDYKTHLEEFRYKKSSLIKFFNKEGFIEYDTLPSYFREGLSYRKSILLQYIENINKGNKSLSDKYDILTELIHMNLNRLFGPDKYQETRTLGIVRHLLKTLDNKRIHSNEF